MNQRFTDRLEPQGFGSDSFAEAMWETLIVLATTAAICLGIFSLATHLKDTRTVRDAGEATMLVRDGGLAAPRPGLAGIHAGESQFN